MLIISHRGNIDGSNAVTENNPHRIMNAIYDGFDVEIDVWWKDDGLYLGHDEPKYKIEYHYLVNKHLWIHCKNIESFVYLSQDSKLHLVYHMVDIALTTKGFLWTAPGLLLGHKSIAVMPELADGWDISMAYGVCTDYPMKYK
jgi:hypothetical protein